MIHCAEMVFMKLGPNWNEGIIQLSFERRFNWIHLRESRIMLLLFFLIFLQTFGFEANFFLSLSSTDCPAMSSTFFPQEPRLAPCSYVRRVPQAASSLLFIYI